MNLYDYKARFYDPNLGRFLQPDPIGYADGPDWYLYAHDDPVNGSDPTGTDDNTVSSVTVTAEKWVSDFVGEHFGFDGVTNQKSDVGRESPTTVSAVTVTAKKPLNNSGKPAYCSSFLYQESVRFLVPSGRSRPQHRLARLEKQRHKSAVRPRCDSRTAVPRCFRSGRRMHISYLARF
jgi:uncharacterized protein RhaS with RHS repeats